MSVIKIIRVVKKIVMDKKIAKQKSQVLIIMLNLIEIIMDLVGIKSKA